MPRCDYILDTAEIAKRNASKTFNSRTLNSFWVVWGDKHIREGCASARLQAAVNKSTNPNIRYTVFYYGSELDNAISQPCIDEGISMVRIDEPAPSNPARYDQARMNLALSFGTAILYNDSDIYCLAPFDLDALCVGTLRVFTCGKARTDAWTSHHHGIIDEVINSSSSVYWTDLGMTHDDFWSEYDFWPHLRYNLGLVYGSGDDKFSDFVAAFNAWHTQFPKFQYFGTGEMILTAMAQAGSIPSFSCAWQLGYGLMYPMGTAKGQFDVGAAISPDGRTIMALYPHPKNPVIHVGHYSLELFTKTGPEMRPIQLDTDINGHAIIRFSNQPKSIQRHTVFAAI